MFADSLYSDACQNAIDGRYQKAGQQYRSIQTSNADARLLALVANDRGVLEAVRGNVRGALCHLRRAQRLDPHSTVARQNSQAVRREFETVPDDSSATLRIAVVSLLFNWPSTGGGTVHTQELCAFLSRAGYSVRHFYARYPEWDLGAVRIPLPYPSEPVEFDASIWHPDGIRTAFRRAVREFDPDWVVVTDSWNTKPLLAEAVAEYPYFIRIAALECLCPLNNVRLVIEPNGTFRQCPENQIRSPKICRNCVRTYDRTTGELHRHERALGGFGEPDYSARLWQALAQAEGVLVVNPLIAETLRPQLPNTHVVPSGFDPQRFPKSLSVPSSTKNVRRILFAGFVDELMKGFHVLQAAGQLLWQQRQDFEILVTAESPGSSPPFLRYVGWHSQADLPSLIAAADIVAFPTIAQDALGRSAVEAMGCGRPVVASRLGGLPWVVDDGVTGLLFGPGDPHDLAAKLIRLLDDPSLSARLGAAGRQKFEREFLWDVILERRYFPLFGAPEPATAPR